jgi:hypothetical protein
MQKEHAAAHFAETLNPFTPLTAPQLAQQYGQPFKTLTLTPTFQVSTSLDLKNPHYQQLFDADRKCEFLTYQQVTLLETYGSQVVAGLRNQLSFYSAIDFELVRQVYVNSKEEVLLRADGSPMGLVFGGTQGNVYFLPSGPSAQPTVVCRHGGPLTALRKNPAKPQLVLSAAEDLYLKVTDLHSGLPVC